MDNTLRIHIRLKSSVECRCYLNADKNSFKNLQGLLLVFCYFLLVNRYRSKTTTAFFFFFFNVQGGMLPYEKVRGLLFDNSSHPQTPVHIPP